MKIEIVRICLLLLVLLQCSGKAEDRPQNPTNVTVYAIRPKNLLDITDKDSADASGDIFFWIKDHILKPMHCRADPTWHQCNETATIDHDMAYQRFIVEYDADAVEPYAACNPDENAPDPNSTWICSCHKLFSRPCGGFGQEVITTHSFPQFEGDPSPALAKFFNPGNWFSTMHDRECGNPSRNRSEQCTWKKYAGKIVSAECVNGHLIDTAVNQSSGAVDACEREEKKACDFFRPAETNLTNCCINAFIAGVTASKRDDFVEPFVKAFESDEMSNGGCPPL